MRAAVRMAVVIILPVLIGCSSLDNPQKQPPGKLAPDFTLPCLDGSKRSLSSMKGKYVLVHFWATWCAPCIHELKSLHNLYRYLHHDRFEILAIALDDSWEAISKMQRENNFSFSILFDEAGVTRQSYQVTELPLTVLVSPEGSFVSLLQPQGSALTERLVGPQLWDNEATANFFKQLLNG
ncbi:MAG: TlpA family protein disulfide reductase [Deltaproteobacteria bacterium]|nr:TlpA family protein disulfide reductase [Deltaproteobacteria bacterium]